MEYFSCILIVYALETFSRLGRVKKVHLEELRRKRLVPNERISDVAFLILH